MITGTGVLKGVQVAVCGMRCVNLKDDTLKILDTYFSYNEKMKEEKNFYTTMTNIQRVLKIRKMRNITLEVKIAIFKTLGISKIVFQSLITPVMNLKKYRRPFYGKIILLK